MSATLIVNSPHVVHETIDGETIIIHLGTGTYYSLDGVGADIWALLDHEVSGVEPLLPRSHATTPSRAGRAQRADADRRAARRGPVVEGFATADRRPTAAPELRPVLAPF